ncbi:hypothetical protein [Magnetofaba australis]|uniref:hypothetical protein n=1 Tax=Magnetofaba australis TaxID=1472297 RepID=UPI001301F5A4|nr:hypothetical protein [Magnetofaba australis]
MTMRAPERVGRAIEEKVAEALNHMPASGQEQRELVARFSLASSKLGELYV